MEFKEMIIKDVWTIRPKLFEDNRGIFRRHFCQDEYKKHGLDINVSQGNVSENPFVHTLRGFHFQKGSDGEAKTISCITGSIYDIIVDIRKSSKTYMQWIAIEISAKDRKSIYVPAGCANAYMTTSDNTVVHYYMSKEYKPDSYSGFNYRDKMFEFEWPAKPARISDKDNNLPMYEDLQGQ